MKFALNHSWRFDWVIVAFAAGCSQVLLTASLEVLLYALLAISHDLVQVITVFVAINVLSKLEEVFLIGFSVLEVS